MFQNACSWEQYHFAAHSSTYLVTQVPETLGEMWLENAFCPHPYLELPRKQGGGGGGEDG